jgi:putative endonuclease
MTVYILFSEETQKYYTGSTQNLDVRIFGHNNGKTISTKSGSPWKIVWTFQCKTRSEALKLEKKIKSRGAKRFLDSEI